MCMRVSVRKIPEMVRFDMGCIRLKHELALRPVFHVHFHKPIISEGNFVGLLPILDH